MLIVVIGALIIRVVFIFASSHHDKGLYDATYYRYIAVQFSEGKGFPSLNFLGQGVPDAPHPPLTILVLAPVARMFGAADLPMRFTMTVIGLAALVVIALIARELAGDRAGLIAATIVAVYPNLWVNDGLIMSESVSALTVALTILFTYRLISRPTPARAGLVGLACGLAVLARAEMALLIPLMIAPAIVLTRHISWKVRSVMVAVVVVTAALVVSPWVVYNLSRFEEPVLLSTGDGGALLGANCRTTYYGSEIGSWNYECSVRAKGRGDLSVIDAKGRRLAFRYMSRHVGRLPIVVAARVGRVWSVFRPVSVARADEVRGPPGAGFADGARRVLWAGRGGGGRSGRDAPTGPDARPPARSDRDRHVDGGRRTGRDPLPRPRRGGDRGAGRSCG